MRSFVLALSLLLTALASAQSLADLVAAEKARTDRDFATAATAYERIVAANAYHGGNWFSLAIVSGELKRHERAAQAYAEAYRLGHLQGISAYNGACAWALNGNSAEALNWLEKAIEAGYRNFQQIRTDPDLASIRELPKFKDLVPTGQAIFPDRIAGWSADIEHLRTLALKVHYNLATRGDRPHFENALAKLLQDLANLNDQQVIMRLVKIVASIGDGHTRLGMNLVTKGFHRYPVLLEYFQDGIAVGMAKPEFKDLLGKRLVSIDGIPAKQVFDRMAPFVSRDNAMGLRAQAPLLMSIPELLVEEGVGKKIEEAEFVFEGIGPRKLVAEPYASENGWMALSSLEPGENALYLQKPNDAYWFQVLPEEKALYFQYNAVVNKPDETFLDFCQRMFKEIEDQRLEKLIIDLRWNGGGNNGLIWPLVYGIIRRPRLNNTGSVFVITGRHTFSAAQNCATNLDLHTRALFVGEPTGSRPNHIGETTSMTLPYSRLGGSISRLLWQDSSPNDTRPWIAPDLVAERTVEDVIKHRDPALAAILGKG